MAATCLSCRAAIIWATSAATGKQMPLDAEPHTDGNIVVRAGVAHVLPKAELAQGALVPEPRHRSHFVTCPDAKTWRAPAAKGVGRA